MRLWCLSFLLLLSCATQASSYLFVSFSLPEKLFTEILQESEAMHIPVVLNGLYHNSMPETVKKILTLSKTFPNASILIDPTLFERFSIHHVPAVVVEQGSCFDVLYGNLTLHDALKRIQDKGECV